MIKFDYDEVHKDLKENQIDVIAVATSHWHAVGIDAFLYDISKDLERKFKGLIIIYPHQKNGLLISEKDFSSCDFADLKFYVVDEPDNKNFVSRLYNWIFCYLNVLSGLNNIRSTNGMNKLYLASPLHPHLPFLKQFTDTAIAYKYDPVFVLIDEGFGTYASKNTWKLVLKQENKSSSLYLLKAMYLLKSMIFISVEHIFRKLVLKYVICTNRFLFKKEDQLKINENISWSYKEVLKHRKNDLRIDKAKKTALLVTQPFSEYNQISLLEELRLIESIVKFFNKKGIKPLLKPHPRERSDKYDDLSGCDFEILKNDYPVEEIIPSLNLFCIVGFTSTALLSSHVLYDIKSISLLNIILSMSDDELLNASLEDFRNLTSNIINFVDDVDDINAFI
ncbi:MAG: hypothetical protein PWQ15_715 [Methanobacterium sp.]|uniref:polysialyltransferase family glycosyltransferase n=1 Tax=Methanobacterium sp. TaxID=2164 RepID=UPI0024AA1F69|nr:polysialyltransferase family glycosyltransferase [Methanobacterium sp.]MDI3549613.1 hypothetical protein [Methanobacterium sp.]